MSLLTGWDYLIGLVLLLSVGFGLWRGLIKTIFALAAWIGAFVGTAVFWPSVTEAMAMQEHSWVIVIVLFLAIFIVIRLIGRWLANGLKAMGLGGVDRILGGGLGLVRAAIFIALAVVAARFVGLDQHPSWQQALSRPLLDYTLHMLEPHLPASMTGLKQT